MQADDAGQWEQLVSLVYWVPYDQFLPCIVQADDVGQWEQLVSLVYWVPYDQFLPCIVQVDDAGQWEQLVSLVEQTELNPSDAGAPRIPKPEEAVATPAPGKNHKHTAD